MNKMQRQMQARMERLERIEKAIYSNGQAPDIIAAMSYDERVLCLLEQMVIHIGVVEEAHNALAHTVRLKKEEPKTSLIIKP